jgi:uncharacterized protein
VALDHHTDGGSLPLDITFDEAGWRYEGRLDGKLVAEIDVSIRDDVMIIAHTGTKPAWRGRGIAAQLTAFALSDIRDRGFRVRPDCPYTADYLDRHPEYDDLVV